MNTAILPFSKRVRLAQKPDLLFQVMQYDRLALKERMVKKLGWTPEFTDELFEEMKGFLYLCATNDGAMAPPEDIDEIWHNFILFTRDYAAFCEQHFGFFINHQPLTEAERMTSDGSMVERTLMAARAIFGNALSAHWAFNKIPGSCGFGVCGASTNCQS
ncbi:MAG: glycine-rich domain-containing protein [Minisyncoccota bacterium]